MHDPHLDALLNQAAASGRLSQRCPLYDQAAAYIAQQFYGPFYFAFAPANVAVKGVTGPGLTAPLPAVVVTPTVLWEDVANNGLTRPMVLITEARHTWRWLKSPAPRPARPRGSSARPALRLAGRRLLAAIPVLWGVTFLTYVVMNLLPGDAAQALLGVNATPARSRQLEIQLHLNEPFWVRYGHWLGGLLHGNLGTSLASGQNVTRSRPAAAGHRGAAGLRLRRLARAGHRPRGARGPRPNGIADRISMVVSMIGLSVAPFVLALVLIYVFAVKLQWFPAIGYTSLTRTRPQPSGR